MLAQEAELREALVWHEIQGALHYFKNHAFCWQELRRLDKRAEGALQQNWSTTCAGETTKNVESSLLTLPYVCTHGRETALMAWCAPAPVVLSRNHFLSNFLSAIEHAYTCHQQQRDPGENI